MAGEKIGSLFTSLTLESQSFFVELAKVNKRTQRDVASIQKTLSGVATGFKAAFALVGGAELLHAGKRALDYAASLGEVSQQLGVTTRDLQLFRFIGSQVGIEQEEMDRGLAKLTKTMGEAAAGSKKQVAAFRELSPALMESVRAGKDAGQLLPELAEAFSKIESPIKRARLETALFGKSGQQLDTMLTQGAEGINAFAAEADRLGLIMGDALIAKADEASDRLEVMGKVLEIQLATAVAENADGIVIFANAIIDLIGVVGDAIQGLQKFGHIARSAWYAAKGWRPFGLGPVDSEEGRRARSDYLQEQLWWDEQEAARAKTGATARRARLRPPGQGGGGSGGGRSRRGRSGPSAEELADRRREIALEHELNRAEARGDEERVKALREISAFRRLEAEYERAGVKGQQAWLSAATSRLQISKDELSAMETGLELAQEEFDLEVARLENNRGEIAYLERQAELRKWIAHWQREGLDLAQATLRAEENLLKLDRARADQAERRAREAEKERQIELARARGDNPARIRALESERWIDRRTREIQDANRRRLPDGSEEIAVSGADARAQAQREANEMMEAEQTGYWRDTFRAGMRAALDGDFGSWFENWWKDTLSNALSHALDGVADRASKLFGNGGGGGGGDFLSMIGSLFGGGGGGFGGIKAGLGGFKSGLPGMANGGSFIVSGHSGIDKNILSINGAPRIRVSSGERVTVDPANDRRQAAAQSGMVQIVPSPYFDVVVDGHVISTGGRMMQQASRSSLRRSQQSLLGRR